MNCYLFFLCIVIIYILIIFFYIDSSIDSWLFVSSPWPVSIILAAYIMFIFKLGPNLMKNRKPINIKYIMLIYNLMQILFNGYILTYVSSNINKKSLILKLY